MRFISNRFAYFIPTSCGTISKRRLLLTCVLPFSFCAMAQAHPLDSPDIVYIDGLPCNSACQSYMAWSRKTLNQGRAGSEYMAKRSAGPVAHGEGSAAAERPKSTARANAARPVVPLPREAPQQRMANLPRADETPTDAKAATAGMPTAAIDQAPNAQGKPATLVEQVPVAPTSMPSGRQSTASSGPDRAEILPGGDSERTDALRANVDTSANSNVRTPPGQISAMTPREEKVAAVTTGATPEQHGPSVGGASPRVERNEPREAERATVLPSSRTDGTVSLALAVPEIKPASDPAGNAVAVAARQITLPVTFSPPPPAMTNKAGLSDNNSGNVLAWLTGLRQLFSSF